MIKKSDRDHATIATIATIITYIQSARHETENRYTTGTNNYDNVGASMLPLAAPKGDFSEITNEEKTLNEGHEQKQKNKKKRREV